MEDIEVLSQQIKLLGDEIDTLSKEHRKLKMETIELIAQKDVFFNFGAIVNKQLKIALEFVNKMTSANSYTSAEISAMAYSVKDQIEKIRKEEKL